MPITDLAGLGLSSGAEARTGWPRLAGLCERLVHAGLPVCRVTLGLETLHPEDSGTLLTWRDGALREGGSAGRPPDQQRLPEQPDPGGGRDQAAIPLAAGRADVGHGAARRAACGRIHGLPDAAAAVPRRDALGQHVVRHARAERLRPCGPGR